MRRTSAGTTSYAIALGSNRRHGVHGDPRRVVQAAIAALADAGLTVTAASAIRTTPAMGGAGRRFANAAITADAALAPPELLALLKRIERRFGRRPARRWAPRVLDLDILLWSGGAYESGTRSSRLSIPHPGLADRAFVLRPLLDIVPAGRHPVLGVNFSELWTRLHRVRPVDRQVRLTAFGGIPS